MVQTNSCADPNFCRGGCCRSFLGTQFCQIQSNCVDNPTWLVILVPLALGIAAIVLLIITLMRLKNRKVIYVYDKILKMTTTSNNINQNMGLNSERNQEGTDRPMMRER